MRDMEDKDRITPYPLRMDPSLRAAIEASAKSSGRSMNAEIVARLEASFSGGSSEEMELLKMKMEYRLAGGQHCLHFESKSQKLLSYLLLQQLIHMLILDLCLYWNMAQ